MDDERTIATMRDTRTTEAFNELTDAIRDAGFEVEWVDDAPQFHVRVPEEYDPDDEERGGLVSEAAYRASVDADAKKYIRLLVTHHRLFEEVPGSIPVQHLNDYEEVMDSIALDFDHEAVLRHCDQSPPPNHAVGEPAIDRIDKELVAMYAKAVAARASELVEGTETNGWTPEWDAIESNDEYECYVYNEANDPER